MKSTPVNSTSLPVSEHLLRHRDPVAISSSSNVLLPIPDGLTQVGLAGVADTATDGTGDVSPVGPQPSSTAWPFTRQDASPLAWWRTLPCETFREAENLVLHATLGQISVMRLGSRPMMPWIGNPAAAIAEAFDLMPIAEVTLEVDIVMSALSQRVERRCRGGPRLVLRDPAHAPRSSLCGRTLGVVARGE